VYAQVVGVADEVVTTLLQLPGQVVEHGVGQQRRQGDPCGVPSPLDCLTPATMIPASKYRRMSRSTRLSVTLRATFAQ
jgi:hypothetical protein